MKHGHCQKHPCLRPSRISSPDGEKTKHPIVKKSTSIPHMIHGPSEHRTRQLDIVRVGLFKREKCEDTFCHTVNVYRIIAIMKVLDGTILAEKVSSIKFESSPDGGIILGCRDRPQNGLQRSKAVPRVKVINPIL